MTADELKVFLSSGHTGIIPLSDEQIADITAYLLPYDTAATE